MTDEEYREDINYLTQWANKWDHTRYDFYLWTPQTERIYQDLFLKYYGLYIVFGEQGAGKDASRRTSAG